MRPFVLALALAGLFARANAQVSGQEVSSLDYGSMIGGPLMAVVNASAQSGIATANFINSVGFDSSGKAIAVNFTYDAVNATSGAVYESTITVPLLALLPIPYIKVQEVSIVFNAKISSITQSKAADTSNTQASAKSATSAYAGSASLSASFSNVKTQQNSNTEQREFSMSITVKAVNDEMPEGMSKVMHMLTDSIRATTGK